MKPPSSSSQRRAAPVGSAMPPVIIIADDLTGACDSAAAFLGKARSVRLVLRPVNLAVDHGTVIAVSTETRNRSSAEVDHIVRRTFEMFHDFRENGMFFKKIDSAGRGHLAAETLAALRASGAAMALVAPAFPEAGRSVSNGVLHIRHSAHQDSSLDLALIFAAQGRDFVDLLPVGREDELERRIRGAFDQGKRVLICDAATQRDLDRLAAAACRIPQPILWTGSAGLALALASQFPLAHSERVVDCEWSLGRTLLFVGTDHPVTTLQISHLQQTSVSAAPHIHRIDWDGISAEYVRKTFFASPVAALILTGGDTAAFVLGTLNAQGIRLAGELGPGVPWGFIEGGDADGCAVVTKSGGLGQRNSLTNAFHFCSRRICEPA